MLNKFLRGARGDSFNTMLKLTSTKNYDIMEGTRTHHDLGLPKAPVNPYKKRPVKLKYDKNEYYTFRLPSEQHFLLGSFEHKDLFGAREGINHSPHIKAQINLDDNLLWLWFIVTILMMGFEAKYHHEYISLRQNFVNSDYGRFELEDFK